MKLKSTIAIILLIAASYVLGCEGPDAIGTLEDVAAPTDQDYNAPVSELPSASETSGPRLDASMVPVEDTFIDEVNDVEVLEPDLFTGDAAEGRGADAQASLNCDGFLTGCDLPWIPDFGVLHVGAALPLTGDVAVDYRIGLALLSTPISQTPWLEGEAIVFSTPGEALIRVSGLEPPCADAVIERRLEVVTAFGGAASEPQSGAIAMDAPQIVGWASSVISYLPGREVQPQFQNVSLALGPAEGTALSGVTLGAGGKIVVSVEPVVTNGAGPDFAVYENAFSDTFLELAFVEVSSDGEHFARFPNVYLGLEPVSAFGDHEPELIHQLAGKYRAGFGVPFDLQVLSGHPLVRAGLVDLEAIQYVAIVDIIGDGETFDSFGNVIFDPYPTLQSAGFELDAVAVLGHASVSGCSEQD